MERELTHTTQTRMAHWINAALVMFLVGTGFAMLAPHAWHLLRFVGTKRQVVGWHTIAGAFFALNGLIYASTLAVPGALKRRLAYHLQQRAAYAAVLLGAGAMVVTGIALWLRMRIPFLLPVHVAIAISLLAFIVVHVIQVLRTRSLRSMLLTRGRKASGSVVRVERGTVVQRSEPIYDAGGVPTPEV